MGLREQKKQLTRAALHEAATVLFRQRGYDEVTVAEVAAAAGVSVPTLFSYFPDGKPALAIRVDEDRGRVLAQAIQNRVAGTSVLDAVQQFMLTRGPFRAETDDRLQALIVSTPQLRDYASTRWMRCQGMLADALAAEVGAAAPDASLHALARFVLEVPDIAAGYPDPAGALHGIFARLRQGWGPSTEG